MNKENKKRRNLIIIITILLIALISTTYAYMTIGDNRSTDENQAGCFNVNYSAQEINSNGLLTTTNYLEGATTHIILSKDENCKIYSQATIYIHTNKEGTTAPIANPEALKYKVMKGEKEISTGVVNQIDDIAIAKDIPLTTEDTEYTVYLWIDSEVSQGAYKSTTYSGYIYAESTQSSTIKE